jgi:hypothetical protein
VSGAFIPVLRGRGVADRWIRSPLGRENEPGDITSPGLHRDDFEVLGRYAQGADPGVVGRVGERAARARGRSGRARPERRTPCWSGRSSSPRRMPAARRTDRPQRRVPHQLPSRCATQTRRRRRRRALGQPHDHLRPRQCVRASRPGIGGRRLRPERVLVQGRQRLRRHPGGRENIAARPAPTNSFQGMRARTVCRSDPRSALAVGPPARPEVLPGDEHVVPQTHQERIESPSRGVIQVDEAAALLPA